MSVPRAKLLVFLLAAGIGCGGGGAAGRDGTTLARDLPARIDDATYAEWLRTYLALPLDDGSREPLRELIVAHLAQRIPEIVESGDYEAAITHFERVTMLLSPEDIGAKRVPGAVAPLARFIVDRGSPLGDEARVLSALLALDAVDPDGGARAQYDELARWGREARGSIASAIERYSRLIDVWQEHAKLTPHPDVLAFLSRLHVERRDAVLGLIPGDAAGLQLPQGMSFTDLRTAPLILRRAPLDVAAVYLAEGDIVSALTHVEAMGDASGTEANLVHVLRDARDGEAEAQIELALAFAEGRPEVTAGLCEAGLRDHREDYRFPLCLARATAARNDFAMATGWYASALERAPDERELYDEALENLGEFIARGLAEADPRDARAMASAAERILEQRTERFPGTAPTVTRDRLQYVVGLLEMNAGNMAEARRRFEASVTARATTDALLELGRLAEGSGDAEEAARHYRRALDLVTGSDASVARKRASILAHLGDAFAATGQGEQAQRMYRQSLDLLDGMRTGLEAEPLALVEVSRGILLDHLERDADAIVAFRRAMEVAPGQREVYARILSHLVVTSPNLVLANDVFLQAQRQLNLEPEWRVYFALWVEAIAARAGADPGDEAKAVLRSHSSGDAWWAKLAQFGVGELPYAQLLEQASSTGERAEAHFYEGTRRLATGDRPGADRQFRRVLESNLVNFYEFTMALELVGAGADARAESR